MAREIGFWKKVGDTIQPVFTGGVDLLISGANRYINFDSDTGESGYGIRDNGGTIQVKSNGGSWSNIATGGGEANTAANVGTGTGVYATKSGVELQFKSLKEGTGITLSSTATEVTITAAAGSGDMAAATYDPGAVAANVYDTDNHISGTTNKVFTAAEQTKLAGIEAGATADQSGAEIKAAYEAEANTNAFTDAEQTKLSGIEASADVTDAANVGAAMTGATAKATPVDADTIPLNDSAASNVLKKVTWANVKATLKTYFDTLYATVSHTHTASEVTDFSTAADARISAAVGVSVQAYDADLGTIAAANNGAVLAATTASFTTADETKLDGIEASADVTDTANVTAAGALMDSELTDIAAVKALADASVSDVNTGTGTTQFVTPDALAGSNFGIRYVGVTCFDYTTDTATGDGKGYFHIPAGMNGMNLVSVHAEVITAGTTGTTDIQIHNVTQAADMLTTKITIDSGETGSDTAATAAVIDTANDDVATNDLIRIDVDVVSTTAAQGLIVTLGFQLP